MTKSAKRTEKIQGVTAAGAAIAQLVLPLAAAVSGQLHQLVTSLGLQAIAGVRFSS
jgi:hypothetical protein